MISRHYFYSIRTHAAPPSFSHGVATLKTFFADPGEVHTQIVRDAAKAMSLTENKIEVITMVRV